MSVSTISIIASGIVILLLLFFLIKGWRKGFLRILFSTFSIVITIVISALLTNPTARWLNEGTFVGPFVQERVSSYVEEKTTDIIPEGLQSEGSGEAASADAPSGEAKTENGFIDSLLLPEFVKSILKGQNTLEDYARMQVENFQEYMSLQITGIIVRIIAFLLLMIVVYIALRIFFHLIRFIDRIPIIHGINRLLGAVLGLAEALLIIWLVCLILSMFAGSQFGSEVLAVIHASKFLTFIYENNLISKAVHFIIG